MIVQLKKILVLIKIKKERGFKTLFVPCMIAINNDEKSKKLHKKFVDFWKDKDVFAYVKVKIIDGFSNRAKN